MKRSHIIGIVLIVFIVIDILFQQVSVQILERFQELVITYPLLGIIVTLLIATLISVFPLPIQGWIKVTIGFFYGMFLGSILILAYLLIASTILFFATRNFYGEKFQKKYAHKLARFNKIMKKNDLYVLTVLRALVVMPFFLINVFSGLTTISYKKFLVTVFVGSLPGALFYSYVGSTLASLQERPQFVNPTLIILGVIVVGVVYIAYKRMKKRVLLKKIV
ncbi:MAG: TVP38/TMEM64 family protein [Candidatus Woesearchaeota archaeon]